MVQIDIPLAIAAGSVFADAAQRQLRLGRADFYFNALWKNSLFQIVGFSWIPIYYLTQYFGWETTHMWWHADSVLAYPLYLPIFVLLFFAAGNLGFILSSSLVAHGHIWLNRLVYLGIGIYVAIWTFSQPYRTFRLGTYVEWVEGQAPWFWQDRTFVRMSILSGVVWLGGILITAVSLWREGNHLDIPPDLRKQ